MDTKIKHMKIGAILLVVTSLLFLMFIPAKASTVTPKLSIAFCNLSFNDSVYIKYAVSSNVDDISLLIWDQPQSEYKVGTQAYELKPLREETIGEETYLIFDFTELAAKQMTVDIYARAYACVSDADYYSELNKYSILQYAYNKLGKTGTPTDNEKLKVLLKDMLEYGASAQKYFDYKFERLANAEYYQVKLSGGMLADRSNHGLYQQGEKVVLTAPSVDSSNNGFLRWEDGSGNVVGRTASFEYTVGTQNIELIPKYIQYSQNLEYDSLGDGTCYVIGMGTCTDTELVVPAVSPNGDAVIGIDTGAFAGVGITSVKLPNTIEEIGRRAFNNCTSLTDVYFDGTEAEWNNIDITTTGNDALLNATIHFTADPVKTYTVTFKDWNGMVLKTEIVESGKNATAPADPVRAGYVFTGWDGNYTNVISNVEIIATYCEETTDPMIVVSNANATAGATKVSLTASLKNNPGFLTMALKMAFNSEVLTLTKVSNGIDYIDYNFTAPKNQISGCTAAWFASDLPEEIVDGNIVTLQFTVNANATPGNYPVTISCPNDGSTVDGNKEAFHMSDAIGYIIVE